MAKNVFRPTEFAAIAEKVIIEPPFKEVVEEVEEAVIEEYLGPTADDLRREAELFKASWEEEKQNLIKQANEEAERIVREAEQTAFDEVKRRTDEVESLRITAEDEIRRKHEDAENNAAKIMNEARESAEDVRKSAYKEGFTEGREAGFAEGKAEAERLAAQLHQIISMAIDKRNEIINESETQLINLVLLISQKVIKVISENQKNVVINNVIQALRKLKSRGEVIIRVNLQDVQLTSEHVKDFMRMVENVSSITVLEDSTVDRGGCVIETDFGNIDARIASQFAEIEQKILELAPIKTRGED